MCLEFFGAVHEATPAIVEIKHFLDARPRGATLAGLEHLDERYVKAVGYATKATRHGRPKMVLLADIVGESDDGVARAASEIVRIANARGAEGFVAVSAEARKKFWLDRARTAAIARHTNAFKINEDVVIPLERLRRLHRRHRTDQHRALAREQARALRSARRAVRRPHARPAVGPR